MGLGGGVPARADVPDADKAAAQDLFDEARRLEGEGRYAEACPKFARSEELDPAGGTLLNLAACHEQIGRVAAAWAEFNEALSMALRDTRIDREHFARDHIAQLEPKLARVRVQVYGASPGFDLRLDETAFGPPLWDIAVPVDPGAHSLQARAPGRRERTLEFVVAEGEKKTLIVPPLVADGAADALLPAGGHASVRRTAGIVAGALGVAGLGLGTYFGLRALGLWSDSNAGCPAGACTAEGAAKASSAKASALAADFSFAAGAVGVVSGLVLFLSSGPTKAHAATLPRFSASLLPSPRGGTAMVEGTF
jgi:hypothetical protein